MKTYDWIVVGGGISGAALSYELAKKGFCVLLIEQHATPQNATRYSYGGLAYWSGTTQLTRQLCQEAIARYAILSQELDADIQLRELDLLLTISPQSDPQAVAASYADVAIPPQLLSIKQACELEPLLNDQAIAGALTVKHGHIHPEKTAQAYTQAFFGMGGQIQITQALRLRHQAVQTTSETYYSANIAICAGGFSRALLKASGISIKVYFTHAEMIEVPRVDVQLRTLVMPAQLKRFQLEAESSQTEFEHLWDESDREFIVAPILDPGAIQFLDGSLRLGQISRTLTNPNAKVDPVTSETAIREGVGQILPDVGNLPGTWYHCLVAFSGVRLPLVGAMGDFEGIYLFSGFSNPLVFVPPLAQRFAASVAGQEDDLITQLSPNRFLQG